MIKLLKYRWQSRILDRIENNLRWRNRKRSRARGYNFNTVHITMYTGERVDKKIMYIVEHLN